MLNWGGANSTRTPFLHAEGGDESGGVPIQQEAREWKLGEEEGDTENTEDTAEELGNRW